MSRSTSALLVAALSLLGASTADASTPVEPGLKVWTSSQSYQCQLPAKLGKGAGLNVTTTLTLPESWPAGVPTKPAPLTLDVKLPPQILEVAQAFGIKTFESPDPLTGPVTDSPPPGESPYLLHRVVVGVRSLDDGASGGVPRSATLRVPRTTLPDATSDAPTFRASAQLPALTPEAPGLTVLHRSFVMQLEARDADGKLVLIDDNGINGGGSDEDGATFEIKCTAITVPSGAEIGSIPTAVDDDGNLPDRSSEYDVSGSVALGSLMRGFVLVQKGGSALLFTGHKSHRVASGTVDLGQGQGRLVALGVLPVTAKLAFVSVGGATGALDGDALTLNQKVRIKVIEAKLFGAIPLAAGNECQTKSLTDLSLSSNGSPFDEAQGGAVVGKFKISDLNGCGPFNGIVSPLTAGSQNTIALKFAPKG